MNRLVFAATLLALTSAAFAQEGPANTQTMVTVESKAPANPTVADVTLKINNHASPLTSLTRVVPTGAQVAILIDDGLRQSVALQLDDIRKFILHLPPGTEIFVGYMQNGRVVPVQNFTTAYESAAQSLRIPFGTPGQSASPYFCLSDFVKRWPVSRSANPAAPKARFVLMLTNGVDPYNGSDRISNQDSPYVATAVTDAQRAGIVVSSIYYGDAGMRGGRASFSGQSYLQQVAEGTGGRSYYNGTISPVSIEPYLTQFQGDINETYIATFNAPAGKDLVRVKLSTKLPGVKLRAPELVNPGTQQINME
jgi:hypothetical protein